MLFIRGYLWFAVGEVKGRKGNEKRCQRRVEYRCYTGALREKTGKKERQKIKSVSVASLEFWIKTKNREKLWTD